MGQPVATAGESAFGRVWDLSSLVQVSRRDLRDPRDPGQAERGLAADLPDSSASVHLAPVVQMLSWWARSSGLDEGAGGASSEPHWACGLMGSHLSLGTQCLRL